jgi:hypothetical protein
VTTEKQIPNPMDTINQLLSGGWEGLEDKSTQSANTGAQQAAYDKALVIATPFRNAAGKACLDALRSITTLAPTWDSESRDFQSASAYGFAREGQNSIIRHIERCIDLVDQGPPEQSK